MGEMNHRDPSYKRYMRSRMWKTKRMLAIRRAHFRCEKCGFYAFSTITGAGLDVHHKTYERFGGRELPSDLMVVCRSCHKVEDRRSAWERRVDAWATKVYGEDWDQYREFEEVEERFQRWLERRGEE